MEAGSLSSHALTQQFLTSIRQIDQRGPTLRAVLQTNPDAPRLAAALDAKRTKAHSRCTASVLTPEAVQSLMRNAYDPGAWVAAGTGQFCTCCQVF